MSSDSKRVIVPVPKPRASCRLFVFHHAGGAGSYFRSWAALFGEAVEVVLVDLPGRGSRYREPKLTNFASARAELFETVMCHSEKPLAIFGHSMGALLAFEVSRDLEANKVAPLALYSSGSGSPSRWPTSPLSLASAVVSDQEIIERLKSMEGCPPAVLESRELLELLLPVFRSDYQILDSYAYVTGGAVECRVLAFGGSRDPSVSQEDLRAWRDVARGNFEAEFFGGGHFYLNAHAAEIATRIQDDLVDRLADRSGAVK